MRADFANLKRYASENEKLLANKNRIVFFGDSIIEFWTAKNSIIFQDRNVINRGVSGQTTSQMLLRFNQDVIGLHPKAVIILAGINDIAQNNGPVSVEAIFENIKTMVQHAQKNQIHVVLCSVLPATAISWRNTIDPVEDIAQLNKLLTDYCAQASVTYIDYYHAMTDAGKGLDENYTDDGLHPNHQGYLAMEKIIQPFLSYIQRNN